MSKSRVFARLSPDSLFGGAGSSVLFILVSALLLFASVLRPGLMGGLRTGAADIASPLLMAVSEPFYALADSLSNVTGMAALRAENAQLQSENIRLREWYQTALMLQAENKSLQELLNLKIEPQRGFVSTRVIADSGNAFAKTVLVVAGTGDGIKKGEAVLSGEGMVGRVIETGLNSARVLLLSDFNSRVPVVVEGSRQRAIVAGTNGNLLTLTHLPPDSDIQNGQNIVTSAMAACSRRGCRWDAWSRGKTESNT
jgi:rod shape-determining protein MreC